MYLPNGLLNAVNLLESLSKTIDQYLCLASRLKKTLSPENVRVDSYSVGVFSCGRCIALFKSFGSKHILNFLF